MARVNFMRALPGLVLILVGCDFMRGYAEGPAAAMPNRKAPGITGYERLLFDDFGSLNTDSLKRSAVPWKLAGVALLTRERARGTQVELSESAFVDLLERRYGFLSRATLMNVPPSVTLSTLQGPIGLIRGTVKRSWPSVELELVNTGCATCHAGRLYSATGVPTSEAWIGLPSTSVNFERYSVELFEALDAASNVPEETLDSVKQMFPSVSPEELRSLRKFYLPQLKDSIAAAKANTGRFVPYSNGSAGLTNGAATLMNYFGQLPPDHFHAEQAAYTSIPEFGGLSFRTSILCDGIYAPPGFSHDGDVENRKSETHRHGVARIISLFTVGTLGNSIDKASKVSPQVRDTIDFVFDEYVPPRFPGAINAEKSLAGLSVYQRACESCHGQYLQEQGRYVLRDLPNRLVPVDKIGTDPLRAQVVTQPLLKLLEKTALGPDLGAQRTLGYLANSLTGIWATAPYLHNGSVPTLWHLMHAEARPVRFEVGGHHLDFARVGISGTADSAGNYALKADEIPWTIPDWYDTNEPGKSRKGHESQFDSLTESDKDTLLEFLKEL